MTILRPVADEVLAHARDEAPRECCGILLGVDDHILESVRARNLAEGTTRFLIDPRDHVAALRDGRARKVEIVGFYHSHPRSVAYPSATDLAESAYPGVMHLIAGMTPTGQELRLFTWDENGTVEELPLHVTPR